MVQTIQGLNLESHITTVKISLEGENISDLGLLLDKIASFHPIFIHEYTLSPSLLTIRSKLPFLWRESADTFNRLSLGKITLIKAEEYVIDTIIKKRILSMSTIPILEVAHKYGKETTPAVLNTFLNRTFEEGYNTVYNRYFTIGCGKGSQVTGSISSTKDAHISEKIQKDKWSTNTLIQRLGFPLPKWQAVSSISELEKIWPEYEKPVVIKPTGLIGGHGVVVGLDNIEEAKKAFKFAKDAIAVKPRPNWQKKVMIQEQIQGEDYRLLVIDGKLEITTKRIPAFVTGDGKHTIEELVEETNNDPRRDIKNPAHILKPIVIDQPLRDYLKQQGLTLKSIPQKEERIYVRKVASMSQGGITEDFTEKVGKEIKMIVESIAQSIHAFTLGVDVMCLDISKPLTKENGAILEINTMPESYLNFFPVIGKQRGYVADTYLQALLAQNYCKQYVIVGQSKYDISTILRKKRIIKKDQTVGEINEDRYYINGIQINEDLERWQANEAIKCNASLDVIILHHRDWADVKENGLGFDHIDTLFVTKDMSSNKEYMKLMKRYKGKRLIDKIKVI